MANPGMETKSPYTAAVVVSPMCQGGETKDQDKARWFPPGLVACVCDGVTSSPFAAEAAEMATDYAPVLFQGQVRERLRVLADLLASRRAEAGRRKMSVPEGVPQAMKAMLEEVACARLGESFQTTLVAVGLTPVGDMVSVEVVRCGDSAFLAFAADGSLLAASPAVSGDRDHRNGNTGSLLNDRGTITFGPGDELLAKVIGSAADRADLVQAAGIDVTHAGSWLICAPLDLRAPTEDAKTEAVAEVRPLHLGPDDLLLVPKYLVGTAGGSYFHDYVLFPFSRTIRMAGSVPRCLATPLFGSPGSTTAVLPDHFYTGRWTHFRERFPADASFVLATDGFYGAFSEPRDLWAWLDSNRDRLSDAAFRETLLQDLHSKLQASRGDDDISFVWVCPWGCAADAPTSPGLSQEEGEKHGR